MNLRFKHILLVFIATTAVSSLFGQKTIELRVMSMNIKEGGSYANHNTTPFAECIKQYDPDIVALQEVDNFTNRNGKKDWLNDVAIQTGMFPFFSKSFNYSGGGFGNALLSKWPFFGAELVLSRPDGVNETRSCAWLYVMLPDGNTVRVATVHLPVESEQARVQMMADVNKAIFNTDTTTPTLLAGDFNAVPGSNTYTYALNRWQDIGKNTGNTIPAESPTKRLDYVMGYPKQWSATDYQIVSYPDLSDHCFLVVDVKITINE